MGMFTRIGPDEVESVEEALIAYGEACERLRQARARANSSPQLRIENGLQNKSLDWAGGGGISYHEFEMKEKMVRDWYSTHEHFEEYWKPGVKPPATPQWMVEWERRKKREAGGYQPISERTIGGVPISKIDPEDILDAL